MPITLDTWAETHLKIDVHQDPREFLYLDPERDRSVTFTLTPQ